MKTSSAVKITIIYALTVFLAANIASNHLLGHTLIQAPQMNRSQTIEAQKACGPQEPIEDLSAASDPHLSKLEEYQQACQSLVTDELMIFVDMPNSDPAAKKDAEALAVTLKEFSQYDISPIVVAEPVTEWGLVDFEEFAGGFYDDWLETYFSTLKSEGVTDQEMGTWVPFPEANLPYWNNHGNPRDFATNVNIYLGILKSHFPDAKGSILLNSATYDSEDFDWLHGEYVSFRPFIETINNSYIDRFGMQGFPWSSNKVDGGAGIYSAAEFLNHRLAMEAADFLGTDHIWLNTGTYSAKYALDEDRLVEISPEMRKDILGSILSESLRLKDQDYKVSINIFAEDKSQTEEETDWSYWPQGEPNASSHMPLFVDFASSLNDSNINYSLFDIKH